MGGGRSVSEAFAEAQKYNAREKYLMIRWLLKLLGYSHDWKVSIERELPSRAEELIKSNVSVVLVLNADLYSTDGGISTREFSN